MPSLTGQLPAELRSHGLRWLGLLASYAHVTQNLLTTYGSGETQSLRRPPGGPDVTVRELGGINSQRHLGLSCGAGYPSHKATTVSRKENLLRNRTHCFLTGSGTDRFCCWVKTFPQLANKRRRRSSLTGTSRDRDTQNKEGQNTRDCSVWPLLFAEVIPRNQPHLCHAMTSVQF